MKKSPAYLVIDQGAQTSRCLVFNQQGEILAQASCSIETFREDQDRVEHSAEEVLASIHNVIQKSIDGIDAHTFASVGLACQRSSIVCWDRTSGTALSPVLSWQDRRAGDTLDELHAQADIIHEHTGLFLSPHYGAGKLRWCLDHLSKVQTAHEQGRLVCGPLSSFILFNLLDQRPLLVDPVSASRTLLWNIGTRAWDNKLLGLFGVPLNCLPRCVPNQFDYGHMHIGPCSIPLKVSTGDQTAALFMSGMPDTGVVYINIGTGAFLQRVLGKHPLITPTLLSSIAWQAAGDACYVLEGTVNGAAGALQQIRRELDINEQDMRDLLARGLRSIKSPPLFLNGISGVGSPFWLPEFESGFTGEGNTAEKLVAVIESIVFLIQANLDEMKKYSGLPRRMVVSGGLSVVDGLCQRLASISGLALDRPPGQEASARGLAYLLSRSSHFNKVAYTRFKPIPDPQLDQRYKQWRMYMQKIRRAGS